jgi:uncharacterized protein
VLVATTWACNLRCTYCFVQEEGLADASLPMGPGTAERVVDALDAALPHIETLDLHLYGGEPLTNLAAMEAMIRTAWTKAPGRFTFSITTNGTLLSDKILALLDEGRFTVVLSIDGPAHIHDQCRRTVDGAPTHHRVVEFLEALHNRTRCTIRGSSVVRSGWSLAEASNYLHSLPVSGIKAQVVREAEDTPLALSGAQKTAYLAQLDTIGQQVIDALEAGRRPRDDRYTSWVLQLLKGTPRTFYCGAGRTGFGITPSGQVLPCVLLDAEAHRLGHIDDPQAAWVEAGLAWRKSFVRRSECEDCEALFLCGGGCPAMLSVCGPEECDITRRECQVSRRIFEHFSRDDAALFRLAGIEFD